MYRECFSGQGWKVLKDLKEVFLSHGAILAGGTALAIQLGHRISYDLDFFTEEDFQTESIISKIRESGNPFQVISAEESALIAEVGGIKVSLLRYGYGFPEKQVIYDNVRLAGILDIASMKVIAISQRGRKRDFVDLFVILQQTPFYKISGNMISRFGIERINPVHIGKSMVYFSDADADPEPAYLKGREIEWEEIRKFFKGHVKQFVLDMQRSCDEEQ